MGNSILKKITIVMAVALLALTILTLVSFILVSIEDTRTQVKEFAEIVTKQVEELDDIDEADAFISNKEGSSIKISIISSDGDVLRDTEGVDQLNTKNVSDREDIQKLMESDNGNFYEQISEPYKNSTFMLSYYVKVDTAEGLDPNGFLIIRFSTAVIIGSKPFWILVGSEIGFWVIMVATIFIVFKYNIKAAMAPLGKVQGILEDIKGGNYKPSTQPLLLISDTDKMVSEIDSIGGMIYQTLDHLKAEQEKSYILLKSVKQGVVVLDKDGNVIISNQQAIDLMGCDAKNKQDLYSIISGENEIVKNEIRQSFKTRTEYSGELTVAEKVLKIETMFSTEDETTNEGLYMMMILTDVTPEHNIAQARNDFFANASHELKTPLTAINGYSEMLTIGTDNPKQIKKCADEINSNAKKMKQLIDQMLEISKMDAQLANMAMEELNLRSISEETIEDLKVIADRKEVSLVIEGEASMYGNYKAIKIMLKNLVSNAIKYNKIGGYVKISLAQTEEMTTLSVKDNGIGIAKENKDRIFERFYKVDASRTNTDGESSTGLGLSIVEQIVKTHDGQIALESEVGKGSNFIVIFNDRR